MMVTRKEKKKKLLELIAEKIDEKEFIEYFGVNAALDIQGVTRKDHLKESDVHDNLSKFFKDKFEDLGLGYENCWLLIQIWREAGEKNVSDFIETNISSNQIDYLKARTQSSIADAIMQRDKFVKKPKSRYDRGLSDFEYFTFFGYILHEINEDVWRWRKSSKDHYGVKNLVANPDETHHLSSFFAKKLSQEDLNNNFDDTISAFAGIRDAIYSMLCPDVEKLFRDFFNSKKKRIKEFSIGQVKKTIEQLESYTAKLVEGDSFWDYHIEIKEDQNKDIFEQKKAEFKKIVYDKGFLNDSFLTEFYTRLFRSKDFSYDEDYFIRNERVSYYERVEDNCYSSYGAAMMGKKSTRNELRYKDRPVYGTKLVIKDDCAQINIELIKKITELSGKLPQDVLPQENLDNLTRFLVKNEHEELAEQFKQVYFGR